MDRLEILIDNLLVYLPADTPFLADLIAQPQGRYILFGLAVVIALLVVWTVLALLQMIFFGQQPEPVNDKTPPIELSDSVDTENTTDTRAKTGDGFSFFKKEQNTENSKKEGIREILKEVLPSALVHSV